MIVILRRCMITQTRRDGWNWQQNRSLWLLEVRLIWERHFLSLRRHYNMQPGTIFSPNWKASFCGVETEGFMKLGSSRQETNTGMSYKIYTTQMSLRCRTGPKRVSYRALLISWQDIWRTFPATLLFGLRSSQLPSLIPNSTGLRLRKSWSNSYDVPILGYFRQQKLWTIFSAQPLAFFSAQASSVAALHGRITAIWFMGIRKSYSICSSGISATAGVSMGLNVTRKSLGLSRWC